MPILGEVCPLDWPTPHLQGLIDSAADNGDSTAHPLRADALQLCLWASHERKFSAPFGVFSCRMNARMGAKGQLEHITFHADSAWIHPDQRGQGLSHYFAALVRAYLYYHVLHPLADASVVPVHPAGFSLRFTAPAGPPAWERLCANLGKLFEVTRSAWWAEQEWTDTFVPDVSARWAISDLSVDLGQQAGKVLQLRA